MPIDPLTAALLAIITTIVGWLLRDLSRRIDTLPRRVLTELIPAMTAGRVESVAEVMKRFEEIDHRIERLTRATEMAARVELLRLMGAPEVPARVKAQIEPILRELNGGGES